MPLWLGSEGFYCLVSTTSMAVSGDTGEIFIGENPEAGIMGIPAKDLVGGGIAFPFPDGRMGILADDVVGVTPIFFLADG